MATTNFIDRVTPINASWLNDVDAATYEGTGVFTTAGTGAVARTVQAKLRESVSVKDFGAVGDGVTNDREAIIAAIAAVKANGGGTLRFPAGDYVISGTQQTVTLKELDATLVYANSSLSVQIYVSDLNNATFEFDGAVLRSAQTTGSYTLLFDGCSNLTINNLHMVGATVKSGATVSTNGSNGVGLASLTQDSKNITFNNTRIENHFSSFDISGDPASSYRVSGVTLSGSTYFAGGKYGFNCRGNGTNTTVENLYSFWQDRGFFVYDTEDVYIKGTIDFDEVNSGFSPIVKCYTTNTTNIQLDVLIKNKLNAVTPRLQFQSQHNPALQPTPAYLDNIFVKYTELNCTSLGLGIQFDYYQDETLTTTTTARIFDNFTFIGKSENLMQTTVTLTEPSGGNVCNINLDGFYDLDDDSTWRGKGILNNTGFVGAKRFTYTPSLNFGGNATGMTYTSRTASYYVQGGFCTVMGRIVLSAKGSSAGSARIVMPYYTREDVSLLPVMMVLAESMSGLTGAVQGYVQASSGNTAILYVQAATGITALTEANFTNTSDIYFQVSYPV